jgi:hypothetical protein
MVVPSFGWEGFQFIHKGVIKANISALIMMWHLIWRSYTYMGSVLEARANGVGQALDQCWY